MYLALLMYKLQFSSILHVYHFCLLNATLNVWGSSNLCICWESISHTMNIYYVCQSVKHGAIKTSMKQHNWDKWMWETRIWSQRYIPTEPRLGYVRWNSLNWRDVYREGSHLPMIFYRQETEDWYLHMKFKYRQGLSPARQRGREPQRNG